MINETISDRSRAILTAREWIERRPLFLDTETTGLGPGDQIVDIAVVDSDGSTILNTLIKPTIGIANGAAIAHGITDEMVSSAPTFDVLWPFLATLMRGRTVITYNARFDFRMMIQSGCAWSVDQIVSMIDDIDQCCAMTLYAGFWGEYDAYHDSYRWQRLETAARQCGLAFTGSAHRALADAQMARLVMLHIAGQRTGGINDPAD